MLVLVAPGQGAQTPGFLTPWLDLPRARERLTWLSAVTDLDLTHFGTTADADEIRETSIAQPLIVGAGLLGAEALFGHLGDAPQCVGAIAGHSVGEVTAAAVAGVMSPETAMVFVRERGRAMAEAAAAHGGGMTAILGGDPEDVHGKLDALGITAANANAPGQIVAAGTKAQLESLAADPPSHTRLRPLAVAGAFHTAHMKPAVEILRRLAPGVPVADPAAPLLSNRDGSVIDRGGEMMDRLVCQVSAPVRWDLCMRTMSDMGVSALIEVPPAGTLVGLARRALPGVETVALKTPADLDAARSLVATHAPAVTEHTPEWRLLVAPFAGTLRAVDMPTGAAVRAGAVIGRVASRRDEHLITAPCDGTVAEWLAEDGDPVSAGQSLVRLHPEVVPA